MLLIWGGDEREEPPSSRTPGRILSRCSSSSKLLCMIFLRGPYTYIHTYICITWTVTDQLRERSFHLSILIFFFSYILRKYVLMYDTSLSSVLQSPFFVGFSYYYFLWFYFIFPRPSILSFRSRRPFPLSRQITDTIHARFVVLEFPKSTLTILLSIRSFAAGWKKK